MFGRHIGVEVGHGGVLAFWISGTPFSEQADRQTAEHTQNPNAVAVADTALIFVGRRIQALMEAALDAPILTDAFQPLLRVQTLRRKAADQMDRLGLMFADMAIELGNLLDMREADLLRGGRLRMNLSAFQTFAVDLLGPGHCRSDRLRGKKPPEWRRNACGAFV